MECNLLEGKILLDKNSQKIGLIVKSVKGLISDNGKKEDDMIIVKVERAFRKKILIEIEAEKIDKIQKYYAWLGITMKEFDLFAKNAPKIDEQTMIYKFKDLTPLKKYNAPPLHLLR